MRRNDSPISTKKGKGPRRRGPVVGLVPLLILGPLLFCSLLVSVFAVWAARATVGLCIVVGFAALAMAYRMGTRKGLKEEIDERAREYMGGGGVIFLQITYAFRWPRLFACWVALEGLAILVAIAAGILIVTVHKGH
jgi:hypothetical protein